MSHRTTAVFALICLLAGGCGPRPAGTPGATPAAQATAPAGQTSTPAWIDTHTHASTNIVSLDRAGGSREDMAYCLSDECVRSITATMDEVGTSHSMLMPPPAPARAGDAQYEADLAAAARQSPDRFLYLGGGSVLNSMIHQAARADKVPDARQAEFRAEAEAILAAGAIGFGEMAILHLSASPSHAFEQVAADHDLFLLLADIAAQNDVPIDVHMDPVIENVATPDEYRERSSQNPATLQANVEPFESLLAHNRRARIVWAHTADTTGDLSVDLLREMLAEHENLYLSLRLALPRGPLAGEKDNILDASGNILPEWLELIEEYPERFVIGSDTFWGDGEAGGSQTLVASFLAQLPEGTAGMVACQNAAAVYRLDVACP